MIFLSTTPQFSISSRSTSKRTIEFLETEMFQRTATVLRLPSPIQRSEVCARPMTPPARVVINIATHPPATRLENRSLGLVYFPPHVMSPVPTGLANFSSGKCDAFVYPSSCRSCSSLESFQHVSGHAGYRVSGPAPDPLSRVPEGRLGAVATKQHLSLGNAG